VNTFNRYSKKSCTLRTSLNNNLA